MKMYLIVYYVEDLSKSKKFFEHLGLSFTEKRHGDGPLHYSVSVGGTVFEIYPVGKNGVVTRTRIGFDISESSKPSDEVVSFINGNSDFVEPLDDGKFYAVVTDPSGNKIELFW